MTNWRTVSLNDLGEVNRGKSRHRPRNDPRLYGGMYPFIQTGDVKAAGGLLTSYSQTYNEKGLAQSRLWPKGTMCITIAANIAETAILDFPACFPDSVVGFIADPKKSDVRFVEFLFRYLRQKIQSESVGTGSAQDNINLQTIGALELLVPPLPEQREIAAVLGALDDKIELNRKTAATLEAMARALYRSWFVDFDPVWAKVEGREPAHMEAETAALFPDSFGEDGLPEGWSHRRVKEICSIKGGKQLAKDRFDETGLFPVFGGAGRMGMTNEWNADGFVITVGRVGAYCGKFVVHRGKSWVNNNASLILPLASTPPEFLYLALEALDLSSIKKGAAQPFISNGDLKELETVIPTGSVLVEFNKQAKRFLLRSEACQSENATLAALRDTLLPRLMSGELRVGEARELVEDVT